MTSACRVRNNLVGGFGIFASFAPFAVATNRSPVRVEVPVHETCKAFSKSMPATKVVLLYASGAKWSEGWLLLLCSCVSA